MKNIERKEVQEALAKFIEHSKVCVLNVCGMICDGCPLSIDESNCACNNAEQEILDWFNKEYKEPHKWKQWELEVLKHTNKTYKIISYFKDGEVLLRKDQGNLILRISFDTLQEGDSFNIDKELERNGMSR